MHIHLLANVLIHAVGLPGWAALDGTWDISHMLELQHWHVPDYERFREMHLLMGSRGLLQSKWPRYFCKAYIIWSMSGADWVFGITCLQKVHKPGSIARCVFVSEGLKNEWQGSKTLAHHLSICHVWEILFCSQACWDILIVLWLIACSSKYKTLRLFLL